MISVKRTAEFERVASLPRRTVSHADAEDFARKLTPLFALAPGETLRPWQAAALVEAVENNGAFLALPVGQGKTLISWLLPFVMRAERPLLVVPGGLLSKTEADFRAYAGAWRAPPKPLRVVSRELLSVVRGATLLAEYRPDLIVIDEADDLANAQSACSRRIDRYVRGTTDVRVVAMTGTPARKSLMGYWHLLAWALGDRAPVPLRQEEASMWALAIDAHSGPRPGPGPLGRTLRAAREWFRRRLLEAPGVLVIDEDSCDAPLTVRVRLARECSILDEAFERFALEFENPGGLPVSDPLSRWLLDGQLGLGLYSRWNPPPPDAWRDARRNVARFVRDRIAASSYGARPLDTEAQVLRRYEDHDVVRTWTTVKPTFDGATEVVWISRATLDSCLDWLREDSAPGIVWCGCVDFGRRLAVEAKLAYYGQRGRTAGGRGLHEAPTDASLVASWAANKKGFNLQAWTRQLITMPPASAKWIEQIVGRSHRAGQSERVTVDVLATSGGTIDAVLAAIEEAQHVRDTVGLTQKILRAELVRAKPIRTRSNRFRWATRNEG